MLIQIQLTWTAEDKDKEKGKRGKVRERQRNRKESISCSSNYEEYMGLCGFSTNLRTLLSFVLPFILYVYLTRGTVTSRQGGHQELGCRKWKESGRHANKIIRFHVRQPMFYFPWLSPSFSFVGDINKLCVCIISFHIPHSSQILQKFVVGSIIEYGIR